ncbi:uncharacterized protein LOC110850354 [Folsomia candida]|uniref:uncharacterized protein LOC110850354 n=1 Tax=Folsomia candida TaxID=158441 RepID=UPI000B8FF2D9|nr:uncharacterized protein LOC110850354 [Folsomia candida]
MSPKMKYLGKIKLTVLQIFLTTFVLCITFGIVTLFVAEFWICMLHEFGGYYTTAWWNGALSILGVSVVLGLVALLGAYLVIKLVPDEEIHEAVNTVNSKRDAVVSNRDLSASG